MSYDILCPADSHISLSNMTQEFYLCQYTQIFLITNKTKNHLTVSHCMAEESLFSLSHIDGHLGGFQFFAATNNVTVTPLL